MKKFGLYILFVFLLANSFAAAQSFKASADKTTVGEYQRFEVEFTFNGEDINSVRNFRAPSIEGFRILGGPNQSSSMQFINGSVSASLTYSYILQSTKTGEFTIGSASVVYKGKTYSTKPLKIKVIKGSPRNSRSNSQGGMSEEDLAKNVFIIASADKRNVYQGEQITISYKLYTRLNISSPSIQKLPAYQGFWAEDLEMPKTLNFDVEMYKGERYRATEIKRTALFASQSGKLKITPFELKVPVQVRAKQRRSNDIFDDFFNDSFFGRTETIEYVAKSNGIALNVKPLPANAPPSFTGAVGNFKFSSSLDKTNIKANEAVTFKFTVSGSGNIKLIQMPKLVLPEGFEVYDPKETENIQNKNRIRGSKSVEYIVVPRVPGKKEIPPVLFSYFDPSRGKYITKSSPKYILNISAAGKSYETNVPAGFTKTDVELLNKDIRFIKTSTELVKITKDKLLTVRFWLSLVLPVIFLFVSISVKKYRDKINGDTGMVKFRKAEKAARQRLKLAKKELDSNRQIEFYSELSSALFGYLEDKLGIPKSDFTIDRAVYSLEQRNINEELIVRLKSIAEKCEFARFAPKTEEMTEESALYKDTVNLIVELDNSLSKGKTK